MSFEENLVRLVEATNNIAPTGAKFEVSKANRISILNAPLRAKNFSESSKFNQLKLELDNIVEKFQNEILIASLIENVKIRGNLIEYLIAGKDETLKQELIASLQNKTYLPPFKTDNELGDYVREFGSTYHTATDIKTKIMVLNSNPKAYNLDKMLSFLSRNITILIKHWAGRNSRGVSQLNGAKIKELFTDDSATNISVENSVTFLKKLMDL